MHPNVRAYWADPAEMTQLMASGEVQVAWSWNDPVAILQSENFPVGFNRTPAEGAAVGPPSAESAEPPPSFRLSVKIVINWLPTMSRPL